MGTGPFVFKESIPNDHFTATANPHYWRKGMPYLSQITYKPIPDQNGRSEALQSGTIDLMVTDTTQIITHTVAIGTTPTSTTARTSPGSLT